MNVCALLVALLSLSGLVSAVKSTKASTTKKEGDIWVIENERLRVAVDGMRGSITVKDKVSGYEWQQPEAKAGAASAAVKSRQASTPSVSEPKFRGVRGLPGGIAFEADFGTTKGKPNTVNVSMTLIGGSSDVVINADMPNRDAEVTLFSFLDPFVLDTPKGVLAVADYGNGHLYPLDLKPFPRNWFGADRLNMPWVGVCDLEKGMGYALIFQTSDDAAVRCNQYQVGNRSVVAPQVVWAPSKGKFAYPRKLIYRFISKGGYVALAKAYRAYAKQKGLIVPFSEKLKKNPNIRRLFGAPDVWGDASLTFARQAKGLGVEKMLIHGRASPEDMKAINDLGYLTSEYDNYTDILKVEEGKEADSRHDLLPDNAVLKADGQRMTAWLTWDKKTQFMKRCPALWVPTAKLVIPKVLKTYPFIGRFIDVTTAESLYECYDDKHPLTKAQKRQCGVELLSYVRSQNLVVGGEHGIWWAVPHLDYIEGMMSGGYASWPAGHLIRPKTKDEEFTGPWGGKMGGQEGWKRYEKFGIGHEWRVPLWELVFHDCVVSTWYWGDASDWLLQAAPEITPKKDAFNILYGTIPLLWANREGSWHTARDVFLRTYRNTCKLHEVIAGTEMLSHEFVTQDHAVQRTKFSDGTEVVVNFGEKPYTAQIGDGGLHSSPSPLPRSKRGKKYVLPQNGFLVKGPRIVQSLALVDGKQVTTIHRQGYLFTDAGGVEMSVQAVGDDQLRVVVGKSRQPVTFRPAEVVPKWDVTSTRMFALDTKGERVRHIECRRSGRDSFIIGPFAEAMTLDVVCRSMASLPDLWFDAKSITLSSYRPKQGQKVKFSVALHNGGGTAAKGVEVAFFADMIQSNRKLASRKLSVGAGERKVVSVSIDTSPIDGERRIFAVADPKNKVAELCERNNETSRAMEVMPDFSRWQHRRALRVETGELDREDEPVVLQMELVGADPASVRVSECDEQGNPRGIVPAQFDVLQEGKGELCFLLRGKTPAGAMRRFLLLWNTQPLPTTAREQSLFPPPATMWNETNKTIQAKTYRVEFRNGTLVDLAAERNGTLGKPFISMLILSSKETGWADEPGEVERFEVLHSGPVRTVVFVRKALKAGIVYEKTYTFYPRRFDLTISVNKPAGGLYSRAYYLQSGHYTDDKGFQAVIDGRGDAEGVFGKNRKPRWYAVYANDCAHSCIALSDFDLIAYWDSGHWGGIGLVSGAIKDIRMSYVIHPGAKNAAFAENDYRTLVSPVKIALE